MRQDALIYLALVFMIPACDGSNEGPEIARQGLESSNAVTDLAELDALPFRPAEAFVEASWGADRDALSREEEAAQTGPMAIAADPEGGLAILDTVGGRVVRYDGQGQFRAALPLGVETGDDLVTMPDRSLAVLAYRHLPTPGYDLITITTDGAVSRLGPAPQGATMPTALLVDGATLAVESRHGAVHPADGSPRLWGRPAGDLLLRAQLIDGGLVVVTARDRSGQLAWERSVELPWRVIEIMDLASCEQYVAVIIRGIEPSHHETVLVAFDRAGAPLGRLGLRDQRVTDAARPFAISPTGDLFELVTNEAGATVLRYRWEEGAR